MAIATELEVIVAEEAQEVDVYEKSREAYRAMLAEEQRYQEKMRLENDRKRAEFIERIKAKLPEDVQPLLVVKDDEPGAPYYRARCYLSVHGHELIKVNTVSLSGELTIRPYDVPCSFAVAYSDYDDRWYVSYGPMDSFECPYEAIGWALHVMGQYEKALSEAHLKNRRGDKPVCSQPSSPPVNPLYTALSRKLDNAKTLEEVVAVGVEALVTLLQYQYNEY